MISALKAPIRRGFHASRLLRNDYPIGKDGRPLTAYFCYMKQATKTILANNPDTKRTDVVQQAALMWNNLKPCAREKYAANYAQAMEEYKEKGARAT